MQHLQLPSDHSLDFIAVLSIAATNVIAMYMPHDWANLAHMLSCIASFAVVAKILIERRDRWQEKQHKKRKTK